MSRKKSTAPTELEVEVMKTLWDAERDLTISEITDCMNGQGTPISVASVTQVIKRLLEKAIVRVGEHKLVSNVYARTFEAVMTREDYLAGELERLQTVVSASRKVSTMGMFQTLLRSSQGGVLSEEDMEELEDALNQAKEKLKKEDV